MLYTKPMACNFIKKETLALVFSCEFCEITKNTSSTEHLRKSASETVVNLGSKNESVRSEIVVFFVSVALHTIPYPQVNTAS